MEKINNIPNEAAPILNKLNPVYTNSTDVTPFTGL